MFSGFLIEKYSPVQVRIIPVRPEIILKQIYKTQISDWVHDCCIEAEQIGHYRSNQY